MSCICLRPHNRSKEVRAGATCIHKGHNSRWQCGCTLVQPGLSVPQSAWTETGQLCVQCGAAYWLWVLSQLGWPGNLSILFVKVFNWRKKIISIIPKTFTCYYSSNSLRLYTRYYNINFELIFKWIGEFLVTFKNLYNFKNRFKNASSIKVK